MTDPTMPTDDDLSLALDGAADAELLARIEADPDAQARLEQLRAAAQLTATPVQPLGNDTVDDLVATAIDAPAAPPRRARSGRSRVTPWLVAASVVVLMAVGLSLVWAGRGSQDDSASASRAPSSESAESAGDAASDSSFSAAGGSSSSAEAPTAGGHGTATTVASASRVDLPVVYLGSFASADALREATATSFADAGRSSDQNPSFDSGSATTSGDKARAKVPTVPSDKAVDRCAQQLQVTLSLTGAPLEEGYATVDGKDVLVYEFAAASARDGKDTTLVAAVGTDACDEVVIFER